MAEKITVGRTQIVTLFSGLPNTPAPRGSVAHVIDGVSQGVYFKTGAQDGDWARVPHYINTADLLIEGGGATRTIYIDQTANGPGSAFDIIAGSGQGLGADGGTLSLKGGDSGSSNGGNVSITGGLGSANGKIFIGTGSSDSLVAIGHSSPTSKLHVTGSNGFDQFRLQDTYTPTSTGDTNGNIGDIAWDDSFVYVKTNIGWGRAKLDYTF